MLYTADKDGVLVGRGTFYFPAVPAFSGGKADASDMRQKIASKYGAWNNLLQVEITKPEKNYELKLE